MNCTELQCFVKFIFCLMKSRDCEMQEMFTHSHRNYSQFTSRACSSFANSNPPCICPLFARQQRLGPCFGWGFMGPISQDTRHGTATRTLSQAKCKAMQNREQRAIYLAAKEYDEDKQLTLLHRVLHRLPYLLKMRSSLPITLR